MRMTPLWLQSGRPAHLGDDKTNDETRVEHMLHPGLTLISSAHGKGEHGKYDRTLLHRHGSSTRYRQGHW